MGGQKQKKSNMFKLAVAMFKLAAASGIAWELAKLGGSKHPYLAPLSVILCLQTTIFKSIRYSSQRFVGTIIGVFLTAWAAIYLPLNGWTLGLLIILASGIALLGTRNETVIHEVALSVLLVFALQKDSGHYAFDRIRDTIIGLVVGLCIQMFILPPDFTKEVQRTILSLIHRQASKFVEAAEWVENGCKGIQGTDLKLKIQSFQKEFFQAEKELEKAFESLKYNPFAQKNRHLLMDCRNLMDQLKRGLVYLEGTLKIFSDWSSSGAMLALDQTRWANQLRLIGEYWDSRSRKMEGPSAPVPLQVTFPEGSEPFRYPAVLYTDTKELLQELRQSP